MKKEVLIKAVNLNKTFDLVSGKQTILNNINVDFYKGDFTVIMGSSGSGKSTLLYALSGMDTPTSGSILACGEDITKLNSDKLAIFRRHHCGFIFQQICLVDSMSVMDNILSSGLLVSKNKKAVVARAKELLLSMDVEEHTWSKFPNQISGGKAQRVGIIRGIINKPEILFADEPTGALNSKTSTEVLDEFTKLNNDGQSIIMVTHDLKSALRGNRILYLKDGNIMDECDLGKYKENDEERLNHLTSFLHKMGW